jgi:hypothetical protein
MFKYLLFITILLNSVSTYGAVNTGADLLQKCDSYISYMGNKKIPDNNFAHEMGICAGFIDGVVYTHNVVRSGSPIWCLPNNVDSDQVIRVIVKHIRDNPDDLNKDLGTITLVAMLDAFPCPG